jgi:hypothetical protein
MIEAWLNGVEWCGREFKVEDLYLSGDHKNDYMTELPSCLTKLPLDDMTKECP